METPLYSSKDISRLVRERRKALGYTQVEVVAFCNVGLRFLSELENGKETLQLAKVLNVMHILGIDLFAKQRGTE